MRAELLNVSDASTRIGYEPTVLKERTRVNDLEDVGLAISLMNSIADSLPKYMFTVTLSPSGSVTFTVHVPCSLTKSEPGPESSRRGALFCTTLRTSHSQPRLQPFASL